MSGRLPHVVFSTVRTLVVAAVAGLAAAGFLVPAGSAAQQDAGKGALLLVMDSSGSMNADDGTGRSKAEAAKDALRSLVDKLPPGAPVGLRVFGHRVPNNDRANGCKDTELVAPVAPLDAEAMKRVINGYQAKGFTPIGLSLQEGAKDLPPEGERTMVLVSDGEDSCAPPDPCEVAKGLAGQGVGLKVETVGFQVDDRTRAQLQCVAQATGGSYRDARDAASLAGELQAISVRALRQYSAQGRPVQGGSAHRDAPLLEPGLYRDTILPGETTWYAVDVAEGQDLVVVATIVGSPDVPTNATTHRLFELQMVNPELEELFRGRTYDLGDAGTETVGVTARTGVVGPSARENDIRRSGRYYARVNFDPGTTGAPVPRREFPLELEVRLESGSSGGASTTTAAGGASTTATTALAAPATRPVSRSSPVGPAALGLVVGAGLGLGAGLLVARRREKT